MPYLKPTTVLQNYYNATPLTDDIYDALLRLAAVL